MQARERIEEGLYILQLEGDIDLASSPELRSVLAGHARARRPVLLLDFSDVSYVDSSALATIVEYARLAQNFSGRFALVGLNERVRTVFELVRLHEFLPIHKTVAEARAALGAS
jgi:anti-sigma B factor antagonist